MFKTQKKKSYTSPVRLNRLWPLSASILALTLAACTTSTSVQYKDTPIQVETYLMQKCPVHLLMRMPTPSDDQPLPPTIAARVEGHNLGLLTECVGRQSTLIDVIESTNQNRIKQLSLE